jgi:hypothetical protein
MLVLFQAVQEQQRTVVEVLLVPSRVAGYVLRLLSLLSAATLEHLLKEIELRIDSRCKEERRRDEREDYSRHFEVVAS